MPFIPNYDSAAFPVQSEPDSVDFDIILAGVKGNGVISGCQVAAQENANMTVKVFSGNIQYEGSTIAVTETNATITTSNSTYGRLDLVCVNNSGTISVVEGTSSIAPVMPEIAANSIVLACVYVPANDTSISHNQIIDKRMFVNTKGKSDALVFTKFGIR